MTTEIRVTTQLLNVVLRPRSVAERAFRSTVLAPGFEPTPSLDLQYLGGRTLPALGYRLVYLGDWPERERHSLDIALAAAMTDPGLNDVLAQYFPGKPVTTTFAGSLVHAGVVPGVMEKQTIEAFVAQLDERPSGDVVVCIALPRGTVLSEGGVTSEQGLGGFHGSVHADGTTVYYAVAVYSEGGNGIVGFDEPWKNVCATLYHELQETRTDPDVEDAIRAGNAPDATKFLGWYSPEGGEIGDIPIAETHGDIRLVLKEVPLAAGGTAPVQLMWSNRVGGPEGPPVS
jgi:hypothetical protein